MTAPKAARSKATDGARDLELSSLTDER